MNTKKIAIVYDWFDSWGGVERLLLQLHRMYPHATFFTSYYDKEKAAWARELSVQTSFIDRLPSFIKTSRVASLLLYPYAFESFDFSDCDMVISVTSAFAKAVITRPQTLHVCYLLTPPRFLWTHHESYMRSPLSRILASPFQKLLKRYDRITAQRPDYIFALSRAVAARSQQAYDREAEVLYPPFDTSYWQSISSSIKKHPVLGIPGVPKSYYLLVSRIEPYKNVDIALEAFSQRRDLHLVIVGKGRQKSSLQPQAGSNITWLEDMSDEQLGWLYEHAEALIMPQEEDFGYVALEAQFFGCPVISLRRGGALETVREGKTGMFFDHPTAHSLASALEKYHTISYNIKSTLTEVGLSHSQQFSAENFATKFRERLGSLITNL